jgi:hypothetical protein
MMSVPDSKQELLIWFIYRPCVFTFLSVPLDSSARDLTVNCSELLVQGLECGMSGVEQLSFWKLNSECVNNEVHHGVGVRVSSVCVYFTAGLHRR